MPPSSQQFPISNLQSQHIVMLFYNETGVCLFQTQQMGRNLKNLGCGNKSHDRTGGLVEGSVT